MMIRQTIPAMKRHNKEVSQAIGNRLYRRRKELRLSGADVALLAFAFNGHTTRNLWLLLSRSDGTAMS